MMVKPIPADTPPGKVLEMLRAQDAGIKGMRAMVKVTARDASGKGGGFDGVLYAARPDKVRLTGLALMGVTVFDVVLANEKFYFYQPTDGFLYTGPKGAAQKFLAGMGVNADPDTLYCALFFNEPGVLDRYMVEKTDVGYDLYLTTEHDGVLAPKVKAEYDLGLTLKRKVFYDGLASPYLTVRPEGRVEEGGFMLPGILTAVDTKTGYTVTVRFEKYIINPDDAASDFTIQGGEFKGIRQVE